MFFYYPKMMNIQDFKSSLRADTPPASFTKLQQALWYANKGMWNKAHSLVQSIMSPDAAWLHALLHREEGDKANASFWYTIAARQFPTISIQDELNELNQKLILSKQETKQSRT